MPTNFFKGTFTNSAGKTVTKEVSSTTKSATQLRNETIQKQKENGFSYKSGSTGQKNR